MTSQPITINPNQLSPVGQNAAAAQIGTLLILVIDTSETIGLSSTGKMMGVASTGGFTSLPGNLKGNIYIGRKR